MKEQVKEIPFLKQKLLEFEKVFNNLKLSENSISEESLKEMTKCVQCDKSFDDKKKLKKHLRETHPRQIKCKSCDKVFSENCELEFHIKTDHVERPEYGCDLCGKKFVLKWRLAKHLQNHTSKSTKKCHYFNNGKICPYEDIGCMFAHETSDMCRFGQVCANKLCSYKHEMTERRKETHLKETEITETCIKETMYECQNCDKVLKSHEHLISHVENLHVQQEKIQRDHLFPQKCPNCPKWIYADSEMESHYDDFEEFGECEAQKRNHSS